MSKDTQGLTEMVLGRSETGSVAIEMVLGLTETVLGRGEKNSFSGVIQLEGDALEMQLQMRNEWT
jgi:hypothetical protein